VLNKEGDYAVKLNPGNKMKALELLGKHAGLFVDRKEAESRQVVFSLDYGETDRHG